MKATASMRRDGDPEWPFDRTRAELRESERWKRECEAKRRIVNAHRAGFPDGGPLRDGLA